MFSTIDDVASLLSPEESKEFLNKAMGCNNWPEVVNLAAKYVEIL